MFRVWIFIAAVALCSAQDRLRSLVERAQAAEQQDRLDEAVSLYKEILRIRPGWASAELNLGLVYHSRGDYEKAVQQLTRALQHNPGLDSALLFRGASYSRTGRYAEAVRDLKRYLRQKPEDMDALAHLADAAIANNDPAEAALAYAALGRLTGQAAAYFQLSECYVQLARAATGLLKGAEGGEYRRRIVAEEKSQQPGGVRPEDFEITRGPAISQKAIYESVRAYRRLAQAAVAKVIAIAPESPWAGMLRAQAAEQSGDMERAEREYERAIAGSDLESYVRFGQFHGKHDRFDRALALYERALAMEPGNTRVMGLIGEIHALQDRPEKALSFLERSLKANPRETQTRVYLAQCLIRLSRTAEAVRLLEAAPEDADGRVHYLLGRTYQQSGEAEKARKAMDEFRRRRDAVKR